MSIICYIALRIAVEIPHRECMYRRDARSCVSTTVKQNVISTIKPGGIATKSLTPGSGY